MAPVPEECGFHILCNVNNSKIIKAVKTQCTVPLGPRAPWQEEGAPLGADCSPRRVCPDQNMSHTVLLGPPGLELDYALLNALLTGLSTP